MGNGLEIRFVLQGGVKICACIDWIPANSSNRKINGCKRNVIMFGLIEKSRDSWDVSATIVLFSMCRFYNSNDEV
jgi:hypothetical protein